PITISVPSGTTSQPNVAMNGSVPDLENDASGATPGIGTGDAEGSDDVKLLPGAALTSGSARGPNRARKWKRRPLRKTISPPPTRTVRRTLNAGRNRHDGDGRNSGLNDAGSAVSAAGTNVPGAVMLIDARSHAGSDSASNTTTGARWRGAIEHLGARHKQTVCERRVFRCVRRDARRRGRATSPGRVCLRQTPRS